MIFKAMKEKKQTTHNSIPIQQRISQQNLYREVELDIRRENLPTKNAVSSKDTL